MTKTRTGRCLCGAVRYEVTGQLGTHALCHCTDCQRQTGTASSITVDVPSDHFHLLAQETMRTFDTVGEDHGTKTRRSFCSRCGSPIYSSIDAFPGVVFVKAGTLDDTSQLSPTVEIWCRSAQAWQAPVPGAIRFERDLPSDW